MSSYGAAGADHDEGRVSQLKGQVDQVMYINHSHYIHSCVCMLLLLF